MTLITIPQAARQLSLSPATVYRMLQAKVYQARILAGELTEDDVPAVLRCYLDAGFPDPIRLTPRNTRLDQRELERWASHG